MTFSISVSVNILLKYNVRTEIYAHCKCIIGWIFTQKKGRALSLLVPPGSPSCSFIIHRFLKKGLLEPIRFLSPRSYIIPSVYAQFCGIVTEEVASLVGLACSFIGKAKIPSRKTGQLLDYAEICARPAWSMSVGTATLITGGTGVQRSWVFVKESFAKGRERQL